jgi:hypothetical protein
MRWKGRESAEHVEGAVGKVGHVQDAVHQRQAQGHQAIDTAQRQAVEHLLQKHFHHLALLAVEWAGHQARPSCCGDLALRASGPKSGSFCIIWLLKVVRALRAGI